MLRSNKVSGFRQSRHWEALVALTVFFLRIGSSINLLSISLTCFWHRPVLYTAYFLRCAPTSA
jgi:hypothetical protein